MDFERIKITDIIPAEYNPRQINKKDYLNLVNSIDEFGLVDPIIINLKNNTIIGGHQRYDILMEKYINKELDDELFILKLGDIGWVVPSIDLILKESDEMGLCVNLNVKAGDWDEDKLNNLFEELSVNGFDLDLTGFSAEEVSFNEDFSSDEKEVNDLFEGVLDELEDEDTTTNFNDILVNNKDIKYVLEFKNSMDDELWFSFLEHINNEVDNSDKMLSTKILEVFEQYV